MNAEDTRITTWVKASKWGKNKQHLKERQMCVDTNAISKKPPLLNAQDTQ